MVADAFPFTEVLAAAALLIAWIAFRFERYSSYQNAVAAAIGKLEAARGALAAAEDDPSAEDDRVPRWGDMYFGTVYDTDQLRKRVVATRKLIRARRIDQVLVLPTEPVALLATANDGLITEATVARANVALWRIEAFNQLVRMQSQFNTDNAVEIFDPSTSRHRRHRLVQAGGRISLLLHRSGIGLASGPRDDDAWYRVLKEAIRENLAALRAQRGFSAWWGRDLRFAFADAIVGGLVVGSLILIAVYY